MPLEAFVDCVGAEAGAAVEAGAGVDEDAALVGDGWGDDGWFDEGWLDDIVEGVAFSEPGFDGDGSADGFVPVAESGAEGPVSGESVGCVAAEGLLAFLPSHPRP